ncbi:sialate O-acetylesterase [Haloferula sp. BvORR071]|uniref:sialate O-acetylesterase n=1 Tax=Haloferula sp. BvORR071 TaxID=1396141 RepID=UPI000551B6A7|nr:sialate O-acetylesterase [Haloferula sp. BvORR071]
MPSLFRLLFVLLFAPPAMAGELAIGRAFGSSMVLPMNRSVPVHGHAAAGSEVSLRFAGQALRTQADARGNWSITLAAMPVSASGREMLIQAGEERIKLEDILVGRVFLCSGQSNMDFSLSRAVGGAAAAKEAKNHSTLRLFNLTGAPTDNRAYDAATLASLNTRDHFHGQWQRPTEASACDFSAIAWWTGLLLQRRDSVPIGLIENAVGGSPTEAWLPRDLLQSQREYRGLLGKDWLQSEMMSPWARARAKQNLGSHLDAEHPFRPGFLFESGVRDFSGFPFDGVLWYQGETNAELNEPTWHRRVMTDLVSGWRSRLGDKRLPFYIIQLPRIGGKDPLRRYWPEYRKAQADVARSLDRVTLIVTEDLGWDSPDVHPPDKLPVARRLAAAIPPP